MGPKCPEWIVTGWVPGVRGDTVVVKLKLSDDRLDQPGWFSHALDPQDSRAAAGHLRKGEPLPDNVSGPDWLLGTECSHAARHVTESGKCRGCGLHGDPPPATAETWAGRIGAPPGPGRYKVP